MNNGKNERMHNYPGEVFFLLKSRDELLSRFPHLANCSRQNPLIVEHIERYDGEGNQLESYKSTVSCRECGVKRIGREI